ncbi:hypothetical protein AVEN_119369-1 [Araneus ventricosus]|uniref:RNase H type-1 domain-containing protein n=1 Tax=Araneus ventricosus TaxID=182803 RepID=A0A4Y2KWH4_ARAVE|nr:hypothetical protein AVEN_119369-1 [Araneus ventricosus]
MRKEWLTPQRIDHILGHLEHGDEKLVCKFHRERVLLYGKFQLPRECRNAGEAGNLSHRIEGTHLLDALSNTTSSIPSLCEIKDIYDRIVKVKWLRLHWIKAHVGYEGNAAADAFAKEATKLPLADVTTPHSRYTTVKPL